jgi:hypothetical protein
MRKISASYTYQVFREIHTIAIEGDIVAFRDVTRIEGEKERVVEGISTVANINKVTKDKFVPTLDEVYLFKKGIIEAHANENLFRDYEEMRKFLIEKPYSYVEQFGIEGTVLLRSEISSHNLYTLDGDRLPHPIYFSDIEGLISDRYYDLDKIIEKLKDRTDIIWMKSKRDGSYLISSFNGFGLKFRYLPSAEVWEKIKGMKDSFMVRDYLKKEVLGIEEYSREDEDYE